MSLPTSAVGIADAVNAGRVTAREVVEAALGRIAGVNPRLNCFEVVLAAAALDEAARVDATHDPGSVRPLAGVPVAVKADQQVAGLVTTHGGRGNSTPAAADGEVVRRLRAAGAVIVGTTSMPEFGQFPFTESASRGITDNPVAPGRTTGGSSGGSAAAVASGCVPVAIGSDGGGSIRIPASCCGLVGLKPARGRVSTAPAAAMWGDLGTVGPLASSVADAALVYDVIAGPTATDRHRAAPLATSFREAASADADGLRVAWLTQAPPGARTEGRVADAVAGVADEIASLGIDVQHVPGRWLDAQRSFVPQFYAALSEECALAEHRDRLERRSRQTALQGWWARGPVLAAARAEGARLAHRLRSRFSGFDVVITPTLACLPPPVGQLDAVGSMTALLRSLPMVCFTSLANCTGLPAMSFPAGDCDGIPVGAQWCSLTDETPLLRLAGTLERARGARS